MAERESPEPTEAGLARAEEAAAREAAAETSAGSPQKKVVKPFARTSSRSAASATGAANGSTGASGTRASSRRPATKAKATTTGEAQLPAEPPRSVSGETIAVTQGGVQSVVATNVDVP